MSDEERRAFAVGRRAGEHRGSALEGLDPDDEDARRALIEADHPELADLLAADTEAVGPDASPTNPRLHLAMHEIVANQLLSDDPPEVWETARRLTALGYERHEVLHMLASVVCDEVWNALHGRPFDASLMRQRLAGLPQSWERQRPAGAVYPAERERQRPPPAVNRAERRARRRRGH
jgi:hypothetical protein